MLAGTEPTWARLPGRWRDPPFVPGAARGLGLLLLHRRVAWRANRGVLRGEWTITCDMIGQAVAGYLDAGDFTPSSRIIAAASRPRTCHP